MISKDKVYSQIEASGNLPILPEVLLTLLATCDDPESSIGDIAVIIEQEPALCIRVLQLVNSAYYGLQQNFAGIEHAVVCLGVNTIKNLVVTSSIHQVFADKKQDGVGSFDTGYFWHHSLMCATLAKRLSLQTGLGNAEEAYLAGLLHDIGKPFLVSAFSNTYIAPVDVGVRDADFLRVESEQTGINHCEAGSWLVRQWGLGSLVADAIEYHHESLGQVSEALSLVKIVYFANILARGEAVGRPEDVEKVLFGADYFCDHKLLVENSLEEVEQIAASMGIQATPPQTVEVVVNDSPKADLKKGDDAPDPVDHAQAVHELMAAKVRNISLLSAFQNDLLQVEGVEGILLAFEKAMNIQLGLSKVVFFLPDEDGMLLRGKTSTSNSFYDICKGLTLPVSQRSSRIVNAFSRMEPVGYVTREQRDESIADQQILTLFRCSAAYPLPLFAEKRAVGVILLGLTNGNKQLGDEESQLLGIMAQQVALRLHIEQEKVRKTEAVNRARSEAISTAARKLAHEINNPLGIISNYLVTLRLKLADETNVLNELTVIDEEIQRISQMVGQMDSFSQAPSLQIDHIDVNVVLKDIIQLVKPTLFARSDLNLSFIPGVDIPEVSTSKDGLKQVVINLLKNAAEAMEDGGRVLIRTRKQRNEAGEDGVEIRVADSGPGLPETVKENLYKPFVTTKQNGHSGLGLSIVERIITDIGGKIACVSDPEDGTSFSIFLPSVLPDTDNAIRG